jgi:hypothetical protein
VSVYLTYYTTSIAGLFSQVEEAALPLIFGKITWNNSKRKRKNLM